jgi:inhibitor of KinA sporulation pathway (predicted exonuclease)
LQITLGEFRNISKIFGNIRKSRRNTGINDTGGKFSTDVNDTGSKFATCVNDTGGKFGTCIAGGVDTGGAP